jgi:hypothetical protein
LGAAHHYTTRTPTLPRMRVLADVSERYLDNRQRMVVDVSSAIGSG